MKQLPKLLALAMSIIALFSFFGCGKESITEEEDMYLHKYQSFVEAIRLHDPALIEKKEYSSIKKAIRHSTEVNTILTDFSSLNPPERFKAAHETMKKGCDDYISANELMLKVLKNPSAKTVKKDYQKAHTLLNEANALLKEGETMLLSIPDVYEIFRDPESTEENETEEKK